MPDSDDLHIRFLPPIDPIIDAFLIEVGFGYNPGEMRRRLRRDAMKLNAMSDAQLALFGIARADIPAYVFRRVFPGHDPTARAAA